MAKFSVTQKAVEDLSVIWNYTFDTWSEMQADKYYSMLVSCFQHLAENPQLGKNYSAVSEGLLGFKSGRHIIFYIKMNENTVSIIRILHEQMDLKNRIQE